MFSGKSSQRPDFVETLLRTGTLNATNVRDYIYGIMGITGFPAKAMSINDWSQRKHDDVFIPIDYSTDVDSIKIAVSWAVIMEIGLVVLAKFKAVELQVSDDSLPSWVIDWRLAAELFTELPFKEFRRTLSNVWHVFYPRNPALRGSRDRLQATDTSSLSHYGHRQLRLNMNSKVAFGELIVRGETEEQFYIKNNSVWHRKTLGHKLAWRLNFEASSEDLVVRLADFHSMIGELPQGGGLWVLRPVRNEKFAVVACLVYDAGPTHENACHPYKKSKIYAWSYWQWFWDTKRTKTRHCDIAHS
ncbi:hypothetical protein K491DRAFT_714408 [Lophiostoma macrostomum CBS 122681]|uniref:Heterokaryon incompatibility domain-containing protein n=1 Tax=Lophiostoma macrostomum CBS 122681 TaxID=1314788 RepID=A0A6A6TC52_9PLEO|nr:hypothetical protein K491DRAFT_714408 [Lophiostoma macrostomum CBS 122681]